MYQARVTTKNRADICNSIPDMFKELVEATVLMKTPTTGAS